MSKAREALLEQLIDEADLHSGIERLVDRVAADFDGDELYVIGLLRGSFMFAADLVRLLHRRGIRLVIDFMTAASYGAGTESSGQVEMVRDIRIDLKDKPVLLVDDILDTGRARAVAARHLAERGPPAHKTGGLQARPTRGAV